MAHTFATYDKLYIKMLEWYSNNPNSGRVDMNKALFPTKSLSHYVDEFRSLVHDKLLIESGKSGNKALYKITDEGTALLESALKTKAACKFIDVLGAEMTYEEMFIRAAVDGDYDILSKEYYDANIAPLFCNDDVISKHLRNKVMKMNDRLERLKNDWSK